MAMFGYMTDTETVEPLNTVEVEAEGKKALLKPGSSKQALPRSFCPQHLQAGTTFKKAALNYVSIFKEQSVKWRSVSAWKY